MNTLTRLAETADRLDNAGFHQTADFYTDALLRYAEKETGKTLNKPFYTPGGPKKFSVYVKGDSGNVKKVNFGDPNMEIKRDDPARRKNYRARHHCENPGPKDKANYWSCKMWAGKDVSSIVSESDNESTRTASNAHSIDMDYSTLINFLPVESLMNPYHIGTHSIVYQVPDNFDFSCYGGDISNLHKVASYLTESGMTREARDVMSSVVRIAEEIENTLIEASSNTPTNPELWSKCKSEAKSKFDVYPSAYANGWAAKRYKAKGGGWKKKTVKG